MMNNLFKEKRKLMLKQMKYHWQLYFFILPAVLLILLFAYYPAASGVFHSFFFWNGQDISYFTGLENYRLLLADPIFRRGFGLIFILTIANIFKMFPSVITAVWVHRLKSEKAQYWYRVAFVIPMIVPSMVFILIWKLFYDPTIGPLNDILRSSGLMNVLIWLDSNFLHWSSFALGKNPAWLGDPNLAVPSLLFWGFPWVGAFGVLIYLAGLQNIGAEIYESADIDGVGWFRKFWSIELPLIMTQIRLSLILVFVGTLQDFGTILIMFGENGGPGGVVDVPGLYMYRAAFFQQKAGLACAAGIILFVIIYFLTTINNKIVKSQK
jgi:raffinose/stachyose/melibiose transport system permease protein